METHNEDEGIIGKTAISRDMVTFNRRLTHQHLFTAAGVPGALRLSGRVSFRTHPDGRYTDQSEQHGAAANPPTRHSRHISESQVP